MSQSGAQHSPVELLTVGDFDPQGDRAIEFDFVGRVIAGRYAVRAHVGGGGMADVFQATDEQLGIDVAIKLLKPRIASDEVGGWRMDPAGCRGGRWPARCTVCRCLSLRPWVPRR